MNPLSPLGENFFTDLINNLPVNIFWKNVDGVYLGCNQAFAESIGLKSPAEVIGKTDYDLPVDAINSNAYRQDDLRVMQSGQSKLNIEEEQTLASGEKKYLLTSKVALVDEQQQSVGVLCVYYDITHLKQHQLTLQQEKEKAEASERVKSQFLANMSHDIRTPLNGIIGMAEALKNPNLDAKKHDTYVQHLVDASKQLLGLCNNIIDASELKLTPKRQLMNEKIYLRDIVQNVIDLLTPALEVKNLDFKLDYDPRIPKTLIGHGEQIHRVLLNLLANATKFTEQGHIILTVKTESRDEEKSHITFIVTDTGIGLTTAEQKRIFNLFERCTPSYNNEYQGAGLGLYISKNFVEKMQGTITVSSKPGEGSAFSFTLPLQLTDEAKKTNTDTKMTSTHCHLRHGRALLVEDDQLSAMVAQMILAQTHQHIDHVSDGLEALECLKREAYDIIYLDIGLPNMNGDEVARQFRAWEKINRKTRTPIIAITAHVGTEQQQNCIQAGIDQVLTKPINAEQLLTTIAHLMR